MGLLKSFVKTVMSLMSTKHGSMPASGLPPQTAGLSISKPVSRPSPKGLRNWLTGLQNTIVLKSVWNLPASTGFLYSRSWKKLASFVTLAHPKYMKPQKGNKTDLKDAK